MQVEKGRAGHSRMTTVVLLSGALLLTAFGLSCYFLNEKAQKNQSAIEYFVQNRPSQNLIWQESDFAVMPPAQAEYLKLLQLQHGLQRAHLSLQLVTKSEVADKIDELKQDWNRNIALLQPIPDSVINRLNSQSDEAIELQTISFDQRLQQATQFNSQKQIAKNALDQWQLSKQGSKSIPLTAQKSLLVHYARAYLESDAGINIQPLLDGLGALKTFANLGSEELSEVILSFSELQEENIRILKAVDSLNFELTSISHSIELELSERLNNLIGQQEQLKFWQKLTSSAFLLLFLGLIVFLLLKVHSIRQRLRAKLISIFSEVNELIAHTNSEGDENQKQRYLDDFAAADETLDQCVDQIQLSLSELVDRQSKVYEARKANENKLIQELETIRIKIEQVRSKDFDHQLEVNSHNLEPIKIAFNHMLDIIASALYEIKQNSGYIYRLNAEVGRLNQTLVLQSQKDVHRQSDSSKSAQLTKRLNLETSQQHRQLGAVLQESLEDARLAREAAFEAMRDASQFKQSLIASEKKIKLFAEYSQELKSFQAQLFSLAERFNVLSLNADIQSATESSKESLMFISQQVDLNAARCKKLANEFTQLVDQNSLLAGGCLADSAELIKNFHGLGRQLSCAGKTIRSNEKKLNQADVLSKDLVERFKRQEKLSSNLQKQSALMLQLRIKLNKLHLSQQKHVGLVTQVSKQLLDDLALFRVEARSKLRQNAGLKSGQKGKRQNQDHEARQKTVTYEPEISAGFD